MSPASAERNLRWLLVSGLLFAAVTALRFSTTNVGDGLATLYVIPVCLVAVGAGVRGALAASALASGLIFAWGRWRGLDLPEVGHFVRFAAFAVVGVWMADLQRKRVLLFGRLESMAHTDDLTGLPNRRAWDTHLAWALAHARRSNVAVAVGVIDLDHFKAYNDEHGHQAGDRLLVAAAAAWGATVRAADFVARYGGEEFAFVLWGCDEEAARGLADRVRLATPSPATCSIGIAAWDGEEPPDAVVARADAALYAAKAGGRNRVVAGGPAIRGA